MAQKEAPESTILITKANILALNSFYGSLA